MPHKSFFCPQCNPFSLQKWNALGPTIPKWCNTCILEARKGWYQIGAWVPSGGKMAPCWYPPFWTSNIQVLHHFGIVRPRAFHFWRENRRLRGGKLIFEGSKVANNWILRPPKLLFYSLIHLFSLQKWNALGLTIPKWCNTCLLYTSWRCRRSTLCRSRWSPYH